jgi:hypothetical protein
MISRYRRNWVIVSHRQPRNRNLHNNVIPFPRISAAWTTPSSHLLPSPFPPENKIAEHFIVRTALAQYVIGHGDTLCHQILSQGGHQPVGRETVVFCILYAPGYAHAMVGGCLVEKKSRRNVMGRKKRKKKRSCRGAFLSLMPRGKGGRRDCGRKKCYCCDDAGQ